MNESERSQHHVPPDPSGIDEPHDILAAEEFGIGTRENRFPGDPTGIREPHNVLAAEEFAMPAGVEPPRGPLYYTMLAIGLIATVAATTAVTRAARRAMKNV